MNQYQMNQEQWERFLTESDPADRLDAARKQPTDHVSTDHVSTDHVSVAQQHWEQLFRRRVQRKRFVKQAVIWAVAASLIFLAVGATFVWKSRSIDQSITVADATSGETALPGRLSRAADPEIQVSPDRVDQMPADRNVPLTRAVPRRIAVKDASERDLKREFAVMVRDAGVVGGKQWMVAVRSLAQSHPRVQRAAIGLAGKMESPEMLDRAFLLVSQAAGAEYESVLSTWLNDSALRQRSLYKLASTASAEELIQLSPHAVSKAERIQICRHLVSSPSPIVVGALMQMTNDAQWRAAIRFGLGGIHPDHAERLVMKLREPDSTVRTSAAFLLASIPGDLVDQIVGSMILQKRFLQPAYIALLARDTPNARAMLVTVAQRVDLAPAFFSARLNFQKLERPLHQWLAETKGDSHETSQQSNDPGLDVGEGVAKIGGMVVLLRGVALHPMA